MEGFKRLITAAALLKLKAIQQTMKLVRLLVHYRDTIINRSTSYIFYRCHKNMDHFALVFYQQQQVQAFLTWPLD